MKGDGVPVLRSVFRGVRNAYERVATVLESTVVFLQRRYTPLGRFTPGPFEGWAFLRTPALLGFVAMLMVLVGGSFSDSPYKLNMPGTWFFGEPTSTPNPPASQSTLLLSIVFTYGGIVLFTRVWLRLAEIVKLHPGAPKRALWKMFALWVSPLVVAPPLLSRDVFSYAAQGEMVAHHLSPYLYGPFTLGSGPFVLPVDPRWGNAPAPYGPFFLWIDGVVNRLAHHNQLATVVGLRLLELGAVIVLGYAIRLLAMALRRDPNEAFVLGALNPLTLLTLVGGAHNDALMAALLTLGVALALRRRLWWASALIATAAAVKAPAALGLVFVAWNWRGVNASLRARLRPLVTAGVVGVAVLGWWTWMAGFGFGWVNNLMTNGNVRSWAAPSTGIGMFLHYELKNAGVTTNLSHLLSVTRSIGLLIALAFTSYLLRRSEQRGWVRSLAVALLVIVLLGPVVQPWYLAWGLVLLATSYRGREHFWLLALTAVGPFIGLPGGHMLFVGLANANVLLVASVVALLGAVVAVPMGRWTQWSWPEQSDAALASA